MKTKLDIINQIYQLNSTTAASTIATYNTQHYNTRIQSDLDKLIDNLDNTIMFSAYLDEYENKIILNISE